MPDALTAGRVEGIGIFNGVEQLVAVAFIRLEGDACYVDALAVAIGFRHRGHGSALKRLVVEAAGRLGAKVVISIVHVDNAPMEQINRRLGGHFEVIENDEHAWWVIPVP